MSAVSSNRRLLLLRHAKSDWEDPSLSDHDRPLNARGRRDAPRLGRHIAQSGYVPSLALCSSSRRTCETFERLLPELPSIPRLEVLPDLYLASAETLLQHVREVHEDVQDLLVIAHNPGTGELASLLARRGDTTLRETLRRKYPTAALAVFRGAAASWRSFAGELVDFTRPKDLD